MWQEKDGIGGANDDPDLETSAINALLCCVRSRCLNGTCVVFPFAIFMLVFLCIPSSKAALKRAFLVVSFVPPGVYVCCGLALLILVCHRQISSDMENARTAHRFLQTQANLTKIAVTTGQDGVTRNFPGRQALFLHAAKTGDVENFRFCLNNGQSVDEVDHLGRSALHWAALSGSDDIVALLLRNGASLDLQDALDKLTPLHYAAYYGHIKATRLLVNAGATLTIQDDRRMNALQIAEMASLKLSSVQPSHQMIIQYLRIAMKDDATPPLEHITGLTVQNLVDRQMNAQPQIQ